MLYAGLELSLLVLTCRDLTDSTTYSARAVASAALYLLDAVVFVALSVLEHSKSVRSSFLLNGYLIISLLFDVVRTRTLWLSASESATTAIFTAAVASKVAILFLEAQSKARWISGKDYSPESLSGLFTLSCFSWLNRLIAKGYSKVMTLEDLFQLDAKLSAEHYNSTFHTSWIDAGRKSRHRRLVWALVTTLKMAYLTPSTAADHPRRVYLQPTVSYKLSSGLLAERACEISQRRIRIHRCGWHRLYRACRQHRLLLVLPPQILDQHASLLDRCDL